MIDKVITMLPDVTNNMEIALLNYKEDSNLKNLNTLKVELFNYRSLGEKIEKVIHLGEMNDEIKSNSEISRKSLRTSRTDILSPSKTNILSPSRPPVIEPIISPSKSGRLSGRLSEGRISRNKFI